MPPKTSTASHRKSISRRASSSRKKKQATPRTMPVWLRNLLTFSIVTIFSVGFYWFFIRPYVYRQKPCYGLKGYGVRMPCSYEVHGIDVPHYQGIIDWNKLLRNKETRLPIHFIFMKATEGSDHGDETFTENFSRARKYGFIRGAYHYFLPKTDAYKQADFFTNTVQLMKGDLPPVLDAETMGKKSPQELKAAVKTWFDRVEAHYGVKPILYTSYKFKKRYLNDSIFDSYPYWIARYYVDSIKYEGKWHFRQHADVGNVPGIEEEVDLNVFNGTLKELLDMALRWSTSQMQEVNF